MLLVGLRTFAAEGAAVMILGITLKGNRTVKAALGWVSCFGLRLVAVWRHWNLPTAR